MDVMGSSATGRRVRRLRARLRDMAGLTLAEVLVAMAVLTIGLLGVASAIVVSSGGVSAGITAGHGAIERGYAVSTATLLAQDWVEQIRRLVPAGFRCPVPCDDGSLTFDTIGNPPTGFTAQAFGTIPGYPNFSRSVTVTSNSPGTYMKTVTVTVRYRYASGSRMAEEGIGVSTIIAARPL
jgi:hypothetical protein